MNDMEKLALQKLHMKFIEHLDPNVYVIDVLYSKEQLTHLEYERLRVISNRADQCHELLLIVRRKCPMEIFLNALCYENAFCFLANQVKEMMQLLTADSEKGSNHTTQNRGQKRSLDDGESDIHEQNADTASAKKTICLLWKSPQRINTRTPKRKWLSKLQLYLKFLCMEGNAEVYNRFYADLARKDDADVQFLILDDKARNMRLRMSSSDVSEQNDCYRQMEALIPKTTDPTRSSIIFLARRASVYDFKATTNDGLKLLDDAKSMTYHIAPCKDTAMVVYMETNLLIKDYEHEPSGEKKDLIIQKMKEAIEIHCSEEETEIKEDYCRHFYIKMVLVYLGVGLMANKMTQCHVTSSDLKAAEGVLDRFKDSLKIMSQMDDRRNMWYNIARAVLCQHRGKKEKAFHFGETASHIAERCQFMRELDNIKALTKDLAIELKQKTTTTGDGILQEFGIFQKCVEV